MDMAKWISILTTKTSISLKLLFAIHFFVLYYGQKILLSFSPPLSCFYIAKKNPNILLWVESIFFFATGKMKRTVAIRYSRF